MKYVGLLFFSLALLFSGCAPKAKMLEVDMFVANGENAKAAASANSNIDKSNPHQVDNLLWSLESGGSYYHAKDYNSSIKSLDFSEDLMKYYREQVLTMSITQTLKSTLVNDTMRPYIGNEYDGVMANTYKALDYMAKGDTSGARVEFNRAIDRQRRAKIFFAKMIKKEKAAQRKKQKESAKDGKNLKVTDDNVNSRLDAYYPALRDFEPYPDFINPLTTYLAGIFARANGDTSKAQTLLKESFYMMKDNADVKADFDEKRSKQTVWLIFENGQAPLLEEWRIDFPIWIMSDNLSYISVALPKLKERTTAFSHLRIKLKDESLSTKYLCSMQRVIKTEFLKNYDSVVQRAILSAATKAALSYSVSKNNEDSTAGSLLQLASAIYTLASTHADTRIWSTLPKEFHLARFTRPNDGKVSIFTPNHVLIEELNLPNSDNILIYVKIATPYALASVNVIPFGNN